MEEQNINPNLTKTLQINNATYNITATLADQVQNALAINCVEGANTRTITFDGSEAGEVSVVSATHGGRFDNTIYVPNASEFTDESVINYNDITNVILKELQNNSILYSWDGAKLAIAKTGDSLNSVSIVTGTATNVDSFARENFRTKQFSTYIYLADDGSIYFGTEASDSTAKVQITAGTAEQANMLSTRQRFSVNLESTNDAYFDGSAPVALGVIGTLPESKGGTGKTKLADVTVGTATKLQYNQQIMVSLGDKDKAASFNGTGPAIPGVTGILSTANGGTGTDNLNSVTVGKANALRITRSSNNGASISQAYNNITISPDLPSGGSNGDIWIKY